jgi:hypothetical protein
VPDGLSPIADPWWGWISVTPDLTGVAYRVSVRSGDSSAQAIVFGGRPGTEFGEAFAPVLSPDGSRLAHLARVPVASEVSLPNRDGIVRIGGTLPRVFLVLGESRIQVQFSEVTQLGEDLVPVFSPDGRKLAFKSQRPSRRWAIGVIDFDEVRGRIDEKSVNWGPEFAEGADPPVWSPDSTHVVYAATNSPGNWVVVTGTKRGPSYADAVTAYALAFRSDGTAAFPAQKGGKWFIVVGGERQPSFDALSAPFFRPDGTLVYGASEGDKHFVVMGRSRSALPHAADGVAASANGQRVTAWCREDDPGNPRKRRVVINRQAGPSFDYVWRPVIDPETGAYAYVGRNGREFQVVTPLGVSRAYDGIFWKPRISEDGAVTGYVALTKNELWWKIDRLR